MQITHSPKKGPKFGKSFMRKKTFDKKFGGVQCSMGSLPGNDTKEIVTVADHISTNGD